MSTLPPDFDPIAAAATRARGKRPYFFKDPDVERVLSIAMALAMELSVTRQRVDALERVLTAKGQLDPDEVDAFVPTPQAEAQRARWQRQYLSRVLRIILQDNQAVADAAAQRNPDMDEVAEELSRT